MKLGLIFTWYSTVVGAVLSGAVAEASSFAGIGKSASAVSSSRSFLRKRLEKTNDQSLVKEGESTNFDTLLEADGDFEELRRKLQSDWTLLNTVAPSIGSAFTFFVDLSDDGQTMGYSSNEYVFIFRLNVSTNTWDEVLRRDSSSDVTIQPSEPHIAVSGDGSTMVIGDRSTTSNGAGNYGRVEVVRYNPTTDAWDQIYWVQGPALEKIGASVAVSSDGNVIAYSCEDSNSLHTFEYDGTQYVSRGVLSVNNGATPINFSRIDMSDDGLTLATRFQVFKYDGSSWVEAAGFNHNSFMFALSGDGNTLISNVSGGVVTVYDLDAQGAGTLQSTVAVNGGLETVTALQMNNDGTTFVIGFVNLSTDGFTANGAARVFEYDGVSTWSQLGSDMTGDYDNHQAGHTASIDGIGDTVAFGRRNGNGVTPYGTVEVYEYPSQSSYGGSWSLARVGDVTAAFSNGASPEVELNYEVTSDKAVPEHLLFTLYEYDCITPIAVTDPPISIDASSGVDAGTPASDPATLSTYDVFIDIDTQTVYSSSIWVPSTDPAVDGQIQFCIRADLVEPSLSDLSVSYFETRIALNVALSADFTVSAIDPQAVVTDTDSGDASATYPVDACHCDAVGVCYTEPLPPVAVNTALHICVEAPAGSEVIVDSVTALSLNQDTDNDPLTAPARVRDPIVGGVPDTLTTFVVTNGRAVITTQLISAFFEYTDPGDIEATGSVSLLFADGTRRLARIKAPIRSDESARSLQDAVGEFGVSISVEPLSQSSRGPSMVPLIAGIVAGVAAIAIITFFVVVRRRRNNNKETNVVKAVPAQTDYRNEMTGSENSSSDDN